MKALVTRTSNSRSDFNYQNVKTFSSLEDLVKFMDECENPVILYRPEEWMYNSNMFKEWEVDIIVEIYDDYREWLKWMLKSFLKKEKMSF